MTQTPPQKQTGTTAASKTPIESGHFKIRNKYGIHARPAALFVKTASRFKADIRVEKDGTTVSGKSIMGLLTMEGYQGSMLRITAEGKDAKQALKALRELIENKFYED